ncbi:hypothetical protein D3C80_780620 [compost metagenome]
MTFDDIGVAEEACAEQRLWCGVQVLRRAELFDFALVHQHHSVGEDHRFVLIVGDVHERGASFLMNALEFLEHVVADLQVKRRQRLVEQ